MFGDLKTIFNNNNNNNNNNESGSNNKNESKNENENGTVNINENENENENKSDDEQYEIKQINNDFEKIDETKSFKDQIEILKEIPDLNDYWYYEDNKDINLKIFKLKLAHVFNDLMIIYFKKYLVLHL